MKTLRSFSVVLALTLIGALSCISTASAQTTQVVGTFLDTGGNLITSGQVAFNLRPGIDSTISGSARFSPVQTTCGIVAGTINGGALVRTANYVVFTTTVAGSPTGLNTTDIIQIENAADPTFDGIFVIDGMQPGVWVEWSQIAGNANTGAGTYAALTQAPSGTPCQLTQNTAITPAGTYYQVALQPQFATTSAFNFYALGAGPVDLSTVTPTPADMPAYSFVDTFSNQSIAGLKTFTALATFSAGITGSGSLGAFTLGAGATASVNTWTANQIFNVIISNAANPSSAGFVRMGSGDVLGWRNNANSGNLTLGHNASDQLVSQMPILAPGFISSSALPALTGIVQLSNTDTVCFRNFANSGDDCLGMSSADALTLNGIAIGYSPTTPTSVLYQQDFVDGAVGSTWLGNVSGTAAVTGQNSTLPHVGIEQLATGGTSASVADVNPAQVLAFGALGTISGWQFRWIFQLSATTAEQAACGISDSAIPSPNNGIYIRFDTTLGDTNFTFVTAKAAARSIAASAVAADTNWHDVLIVSNTPGAVIFTLDGGTPVTIGTNVPVTAAGTPYCVIENAANADKHLNVDFFGINISGLVR